MALYADFTLGNEENAGTIGAPLKYAVGMGSSTSGKTLAAGDSMLLKRDETWREQLTVPSSGSSGSPITFGAYGSGEKPIINGADVLTSWTAPSTPTISVVQHSLSLSYTSTLTIDVPTGTTTGDLLIAWILTFNNAGTPSITNPANWTTIDSDYTSTITRYHLAYHYWGAGETSYSWTMGGASATNGGIISLRGTATSSPIDQISDWSYNDNSNSVVSLSITPSVDNCIILIPMGTPWGGRTFSTISGYTEQWDYTTALPCALDYLIQTTAGATGDQTSTLSASAPWAARQLSIKPAAAETAYSKGGITTEPRVVVYNGTTLTEQPGGTTGVGLNKWDWASNILYINIGGDPGGGIVEAAKRYSGIDGTAKNYITIQDLTVKYANEYHGIKTGGGGNWTISGITAIGNNQRGISFDGSTGVTISGCTITGNNTGIGGDSYSQIVIQNCIIYDNDLGINPDNILVGSGDIIIENNEIYFPLATQESSDNIQIAGGGNAIIRYNKIHDGRSGVIFTDGGYGQVYYNVFYNLGTTYNAVSPILLWEVAGNVNIYNNTIYHNSNSWPAIRLETVTIGHTVNIKNNIAINIGTASVFRSESVAATVNISNNTFGVERTNFIKWNGTSYSTYDDWETAYGESTHSVEADPLFVTPGTDFHLQSGSPCINAGVDVGLTQDYEGNVVPQGAVPDIGAYEYSQLFDISNQWIHGVG